MSNKISKILTIEDEENIRKSFRYFFEDHNFEVLEAADGLTGLEIVKREKLDIILLDLRLPKIDGLEILAAVTKITPETPVIVISGTGNIESVVETLHLGAWDYFIKPVEDMSTLLHSINRAVERVRLLHENLSYQAQLETQVISRTAELEKAYKELKASEARYRGIIDYTKNGVAVFQAVDNGNDFILIDFNKAGEKIEKVKKDKIIGKAVSGNFINVCHPEFSDLLKKVWLTGEAEHKLISLCRNGNIFGWRDSFIYKLPSGEIVSVYSDETDRIKSEQDKKKLEHQLQQAQKMEAIGTMAGGIAHDFNNILSAIIGRSELMKIFDIPKDSPLKDGLDEILSASYRASDLVRQILSFSRRTECEKKYLDVVPIIKEGLKFLKAIIPSTIEIRQNIDIKDAIIFCDSTQIHQIIMNLCTNSAHAMGQKGGILDILLEEVEITPLDAQYYLDLAPGCYARLIVRDNGHGMDPETITRIFEPYYTTKNYGEGTGLGLSVVHGIVKNHDGYIDVYSEPGKGTSFNVYIPLCRKDIDGSGITEDIEIPSGNENILFVDDEEAIVQIGVEILERLGYTVIGKVSSEDALLTFKFSPDMFDLVITDLTMPGLTGLDLSKEIISIRPDIPIILISGLNEKIEMDDVRKPFMKEFLSKPFGARNLADTVRKVMDEQGSVNRK